ncbi:ARM repeat-containing protein [Atractiella rhizophila]|nr:ARM repeat-containing protein [Atractiella rhizophila]
MDFLRSLASSSLASLAGGGIPNLPQYTLGEKQPVWDTNCIWQLFNGVRKDDQLPVSIFHFDANTSPSGRSILPLAKNHLRKLRSIRYPDVLKFLDASETDHQVWVITERVVPLNMKLGEPDVATEEWKIWGLARIASALQFINKEVGATHGNLRASSIFVSQGGEWKLSGFEVLSSPKDQNPVLYTLGGALPGAGALASPEVAKQGWPMIREQDPSALDSFQLYIFIYQIFNNSLPPSGAPQPGSIPRSLFGTIRKLGNPSPAGRMKTVDLWEAGMAEAGFFKTNRLVRICNGLEGMALMGESERGALIKMIKESPTPLPPDFLTHKVLPSLLNVFEFSPGGPALLPLILSFSTNLPSAAYAQTVLPIVLRMFSSPDRAMRVALLENIDSYKEHLDTRMVCDKIWPNLVGGFSDTVAIVREMTVRSIPSFAPKLSERILNNDLLRHLAKTQTDPDPSIRTNTAILLGRLSKQLTISTQRKVLVPAFARAVRDPFPPSRTAGLAALMATVEIYERDDLAAKVIPAMSLCLVDKEKKVRDQAFKAMDMFVKRLEVLVRDMPETVQNDAQSAPSQIYTTPSTAAATNTTVSPALTTSAAAASYLGSWAMSTISKQVHQISQFYS